MRFLSRRRSVLLVGACLFSLAASGQTSHVWDGGGTNDLWSSATNWAGDVVPSNPTTNYVALAGTNRLTPVVDTDWTIFGLIISNNAGAFTLSGSNLTVTAASTTGTPAIVTHGGASNVVVNNNIILAATTAPTNRRTMQIASSGSITFNGVVTNATTGLGDLHIRGAGSGSGTLAGRVWLGTNTLFHTDVATWIIASTNNVWGLTDLDQTSTVRIAANDALPTNTTIRFSTGGTTGPRVDLNNFNQTVQGFAHAGTNSVGTIRTGTNAGGTLTVSDQGVASTYKGAIAENGRLVKRGAGTLTLSGFQPNTYTGSTTVLEGTLLLAKNSGVNNIASGDVLVQTGAVLRIGADSQISDVISNFVLNASTFDAQTFVEGINCKVKMTDAVLAGAAGTGLMLARAGYEATGTNLITKRITVRSADASSGLFNITGTTRVSGVIYTDTAGAQGITKTGPGALEISAANSYTGTTLISAGSLVVQSGGSFNSSTNLRIAAGAALDVTPVSSISPLPSQTFMGDGTILGDVTPDLGARVLAGGDGTPGTLTIAGSFAAVSFAYTNHFDLTNNTAIGGGTNDLLIVSGALLPNGSAVRIRPLAPLVSGSYRLINYGGLMLSDFAPGVLGNTYRDTWTLDTNTAGQINLLVAAGTNQSLVWSPQASADWDIMTSTNWTNVTAGVLDIYADGDSVLFDDSGAASNVVNITSVVRPSTLTVNASSNYVFAGAGRISDGFAAVRLVKDGTGTLTLTTDHDYTGGTTVSNGTLSIGNGGGSGAVGSGAIRVLAPGTVVFARSNTVYNIANDLAGSGTAIFRGSGLVLDGGYTLSGNNTNFAGVTIVTNARVTLDATSDIGSTSATYVVQSGGAVYHAAGTFGRPISIAGPGWLETAGTLGALRVENATWNAPVTLTDNARIGAYTANGTISGQISGSYELELWAGGTARSITLTPTSLNSFASLRISSGMVAVAGNANAFGNGAVIMNGGTQRLAGSSFTFASLSSTPAGGTIANASATPATFTVGTDGSSTTSSAIFADAAGGGALSVTKVGAGTLTLTGTNIATGTYTILGGSLALGATGLINGSPAIVTGTGGTFDVSAVGNFLPANLQGLEGSGRVTGTVTATTGTKLIPGRAGGMGTLSFANDLNLGPTATNFFDLAGADTTVGGGVNDLIDVAGLLEPSNAVIQVAVPAVPFSNGTYRLFNYSGTKTSSFNPAVAGNTTRRTWSLDESTAGQVNFTVSGADYLSLRWNPQTSASWDNNIGTNWLDLVGATNTTYRDGDAVLFDDNGAATNTITLVGALRPATITVSATSNYTFTGAGRISGGTAIQKSGAGVLTLGGTGNDYTGPVSVSGGVVVASVDSQFGIAPAVNSPAQIVVDGGTLRFSAAISIHSNRGISVGTAGATFDNAGVTSASNALLNSVISGAGPFTLAANGNLSDSGGGQAGNLSLSHPSNTFVGGITIATGLVTFAADGSFGAPGNAIAINGGGLVATAMRSLDRKVTLAGGGDRIFRTYTNSVFAMNGDVSGNGNIRRTDGGTNLFNGTLSYTGSFINAAGVTWLLGTNTYNGGTTITNNSILVIRDLSDVGASGIANAGLLTFGGGTLRYVGAGPGDTARSITNIGASTYDITNVAALVTLNGPIAGPGALTKTGAGGLVLTATNSYVGATTLSAGTLAFTSTSSNQIGAINVNGGTNGGRLTIDGPVIATNSTFTVASVAGDRGVVVVNSNVQVNRLYVGNNGTGSGALIQEGGTVSVAPGTGSTDIFSLGLAAGSYGYYRMNAGSLVAGQIGVGGSGGNLTSVLDQFGGSVSASAASGWLLMGWGANTKAAINLYGGTMASPPSGNPFTMGYAAGTGLSLLNLLGGGAVLDTTVTTAGYMEVMRSAATGGSFVNLNGGTLIAQRIQQATTTATAVITFNGGTLRARAGTTVTNYLQGISAAVVQGGGAVIDTTNAAIAIAQPLLAPAGNGVISVTVTNAGAGYIGAPVVVLTGGGGTGATAIAQVDLAAGAVTNVLVTSPGVNYVTAPTVTFFGGGSTSFAASATASLGANQSGGLTKLGSGSLLLNGASTFTGQTTVAAGSLYGTGTVSGPVFVNADAVIGPMPYSSVTGMLTVASSLTMTNGAALHAYLRGTNPTVRVTGDVTVAGTGTVRLLALAAVTTGTHVLVDYDGVFNGDVTNLVIATIPNGSQGYLTNNLANTSLDLVITNAGGGLRWNGLVDATWKNIGPQNWKTPDDSPAIYSPGDAVTLDDSATANFAMTLLDLVSPASVTVSNSVNDYVLAGTGGISGAGSLSKSGSAMLTLATTNSYLGGTVLNAGILKLSGVAALGAAGRSITVNGGTLQAANDTSLNNYSVTLGGNAAVVLDRATPGAGITNTLGSLTAVAGNYTVSAAPGANVTNGSAELVFNGVWSNNARTTTFDVATNATVNLAAATPTGAQNITLIKSGTGRLVLSGVMSTWDAPSPAIALNGGTLELRTIPGDTNDFRGVVSTNGTTLSVAQNSATNVMAGLTINGDTTLLSDRINPGAGLTHGLGALVFNGNGYRLTMAGGGAVTGGTAGININGATLAGDAIIDVASNANVLGSLTITNLITQSGGGRTLTKNGPGTLTLRPSNPSTYSSGTVVNAGTLVLAFGNTSSNFGTIMGPLTINSGATVRATSEKALGFSGAVSGNVTTVTINGGLLEHAGANGLGGGQTVFMTAGEIRSNGGVPSTNSASYRMGGGTDPSIYVLASASTSVISGRVACDTTGRFNVQDGAADVDLLISANITDGIGAGNPPNGIVKSGLGVLMLAGSNRFSGTTVISNGTVLVQGSTHTGAVTVLAGATLGGTGSVGGVVVSSGTVAPGASAGVLNLAQSYTQNVAATLALELGGTTVGSGYDRLAVAGTVSLNGGLTVGLINGFVPAAGNSFTVLTASAISGTFASTNLPALIGGDQWIVTYGASAVVLSVTNIPTATGYDLAATVITNGLTGYQQDADADGYANLLEYATGGSLTNADTTASMSGTRTNGLLALRFNRSTNAVDVTFVVEGSDSAANGAVWDGIATNIAGSWGAGTNVIETGLGSPVSVTVSDTAPAVTNRFLRLRVTRP